MASRFPRSTFITEPMNCETAQFDMHHRLDADTAGAPADFAALDAHLARCPRCSRTWLELLAARERLGNLRATSPTPEEIDSMWQAIDAAVPAEFPAIQLPSRGMIFRFLSATGAVAACLFIAFMLGEQRYGDSAHALRINAPRFLTSSGDVTDTNGLVARGTLAWPILDSSENIEPVENFVVNSRGAGRGRASAGKVNLPSLSSEDLIKLRSLGYLSSATDSTSIAASNDPDEVQLALSERESPVTGIALGWNFAIDRDERLDADGDGVKYLYTVDAFNASATQTDLSFGREVSDSDDTLGETSARGDVQAGDAVTTHYYADSESNSTRPAMQDMSGAKVRFQNSENRDQTDDRNADGTTESVAKSLKAAEATSDSHLKWMKDRSSQFDYAHAGDLTIVASAGQAEQTPQPAEAQPQNAQAAPTTQPRPQNTKVIKTGSLATEVEDYEKAQNDVSEILTRFDCFLADASTKEAAGGALVGELIIRVSPAHFESLFAALRQVGRLESEDIKSADVTAEYVDIAARIAALKITEERLIELVKSKSFVDRMEDLLKVEQEMNRVRTEIEQHEGRLRVMADRVALSTIAMTLREPARTVPSASISVEVPVLDAAAAALGETLVSLDARMVSGKVTQLEQGALIGEYRVKVSLARFGDALAAIAHLGRVEARDVRDWREQSATAKWAERVTCDVALKLFERTRDLPSGTMSVQVDSLPKALAALDELLPLSEAAVTSNRTNKRNDGSTTADLQVRIPAGEFAALVGKLDALGRVTARQLAGEAGSIAGGAADTPCILSLTLAEPMRQIPSGGMVIEVQTFAAARDRLADLVGKHAIQVLASNSSQRTDGTWVGQFQLGITASGIDTAVAELEKLGKVSSREIRGIGLGELSRIDANALGVLEIILAEKSAINPGAEGNTIRSYLRDGLTGLYASLGLIAYGLVVMAPWLVIALVAGWLITRAWKRRKGLVSASAKSA